MLSQTWPRFHVLVLLLVTGCSEKPEEAAVDEAEDDLNCSEVAVQTSQPEEQAPGTCPSYRVTVRGCGTSAAYRCKPFSRRDCDYTCDRID